MASSEENKVLWNVAIGARAADAIKLGKKTVDTAMQVEYSNPNRLATADEMKAAGLEACLDLRDKLAALQANAKSPLTVHLHYCGPYTMGIYLGMLVFSYKIPVVSISSFDRETKGAIVVVIGGDTDVSAEAAAVSDKTW